MTPLDLILERLRAAGEEPRRNGEWWMAHCPAHDDSTPSLGVKEEPKTGRAVVKCFAGCDDKIVLERLGLRVKDLFPPKTKREEPFLSVRAGFTLEELAQAKKLPVDFLRSLGVDTTWCRKARGENSKTIIEALTPKDQWESTTFKSQWREVLIRYRLPDGSNAPRHRRRYALTGERFAWTGTKNDGGLVPYGLDRLQEARDKKFVILVEGESDCWTLWHHAYPALGIPGAKNTAALKREHLDGIDKVYFIQEPDTGGETMLAGLRKCLGKWRSWAGEFFRIVLDDVKDASALHVKAPDVFSATLDAALAHAELIPTKRSSSFHAVPSAAMAGLPGVVVDDIQLADLTAKAVDAIVAANDPPSVFVRGGFLSRITRNEDGFPVIERFEKTRMRCRLAQIARWLAYKSVNHEKVEIDANPPMYVAENILALGSWPFPALLGIAQAPILRPDGSICTTPGYDAETKLFYFPARGLVVPPIPETPTADQVDSARNALLDLVADFPFDGEASRTNALSLIFSVLMRPAIPGNIPLLLIDAPVQGTGKTLLIKALGSIAVEAVPVQTVPSAQRDPEEEWRKRITSILLECHQLVLIDNVPETMAFDSINLAAVLTSPEWIDRRLGKNETVSVPSRCVWTATGNNIRVTGDMPRRCYTSRLDSNAERPWERNGFRHEDLIGHVLSRRGDLLAAAYTLIRAWYAAGKPSPSANIRFGSFQEWADMVGGVLSHSGIPKFLGNLESVRVVQDEDARQWSAFFVAWWETIKTDPVTAEELCRRIMMHESLTDEALPDALLMNRDKGSASLKKSLGRHLARLTGRIFNGHKLLDAGADTHAKVRRWKLAAVDCGVSGYSRYYFDTPHTCARKNETDINNPYIYEETYSYIKSGPNNPPKPANPANENSADSRADSDIDPNLDPEIVL